MLPKRNTYLCWAGLNIILQASKRLNCDVFECEGTLKNVNKYIYQCKSMRKTRLMEYINRECLGRSHFDMYTPSSTQQPHSRNTSYTHIFKNQTGTFGDKNCNVLSRITENVIFFVLLKVNKNIIIHQYNNHKISRNFNYRG